MATIDELTIPATLDDPTFTDFARVIEIRNVVEAAAFGTTDLMHEAVEALPFYNDRFHPRRILTARVDGTIVGQAEYETFADDDTGTAWLGVRVLSEFRGLGIGRALANALEELCASAGKTKALAYVGVQDAPGERIASPTGFGSVPIDNRDVRFMLARGYSFEQIERLSRLSLPVAGLATAVAAAHDRSGADYAIHTWTGATPERWQQDAAVLSTRMSTDAPTAGLEEPEDIWTVERVIAADERNAKSPQIRLKAYVEHVPSGHLVGFTVLSAPVDIARPVDQYATLVLREHRGHQLGMLLKVANLAHLEQLHPGHPSVITFNAEENRHMLSVNEALGFIGIGFESAWRKDLA